MSYPWLVFFLSLSLLSIPAVLSDILCEDSVIDSIAYASDIDMYFFTSGGHYWYIKESQFPPKEKDAKPLPAPFKRADAAVYVDGDSGCASARTAGVTANEKEIWIIASMDGTNKLLSYDIKTGRWGKEAIKYNNDHCIQRAKIDWSKGRPINAMFSLNILDIYLVQNNSYAMVDCKFICTNPSGTGIDKDPNPISDFNTEEAINGLFVKNNKDLYMFHKKTYYLLNVQQKNGRLTTQKKTTGADIFKEFFKFKTLGKCSSSAATPSAPVEEPEPQPKPEPEPAPEEDNKPQAGENERPFAPEDKEPEKDESSSGWIWIIVAVVVVVLILMAVLVFFMMRKKSSPATGGAKDVEPGAKSSVGSTTGAGTSKVGSKMDSKVGSKAGGSRMSPSKATPSSMSTMSMRSQLPANKSRSPKSGVKSSMSKN